MADGNATNLSDANKFRPFALIENALLTSLRALISTTTELDISTTNTTQMAGALTLALSYINKATMTYSNVGTSSKPAATGLESTESTSGLQSRILVVSVSGDLAHQYIPIMNTTFAAQRQRIPIDILKLAGDTVFLQQASDATKGIYMQLRNPKGILQCLMMAFLPDQTSRKHLIAPTQEVVDFRAACFCHRKVVDIGFVCSICLSSSSSHLFPLLQDTDLASILHFSRRRRLLDMRNSSCARRIRGKACCGLAQEEEKEEDKWGRGYRECERHTRPW